MPETVLQNVTALGNYTLYDPVNVFSVYRDTYDSAWLDTSKHRIQADFTSWTTLNGEINPPFTDVLFLILIEPDPQKYGRMELKKTHPPTLPFGSSHSTFLCLKQFYGGFNTSRSDQMAAYRTSS